MTLLKVTSKETRADATQGQPPAWGRPCDGAAPSARVEREDACGRRELQSRAAYGTALRGVARGAELRRALLAAALGLCEIAGCAQPSPQATGSVGASVAGTAAKPAGSSAGRAGSGAGTAGAAVGVAGRSGGVAGTLAVAGSSAAAGASGAGVSIGAAGAAGSAEQATAGASGQAGVASSGGAGGLATQAGTGGELAAGGGEAQAGSSAVGTCAPWPTAKGEQAVSETIKVSGHLDGGLKRYKGSGALGSDDQSEDQGPLFDLAENAVLENVILGTPAADGIHCNGTCTLRNVWWEDVGEDAATFRASNASATMTIECAGAKHASDKVLQHNGPGTMIVRQFYADDFGKLYRSCGNCKTQYERHIELHAVDIKNCKSTLVGINTNYKDGATFDNITIHGDSGMKTEICDRFTGNDQGDEPTKTGTGADGQYCKYSAGDIHWVP